MLNYFMTDLVIKFNFLYYMMFRIVLKYTLNVKFVLNYYLT